MSSSWKWRDQILGHGKPCELKSLDQNLYTVEGEEDHLRLFYVEGSKDAWLFYKGRHFHVQKSEASWQWDDEDASDAQISAALNGTIKKIYIKEGEAIQKGQKLMTLEAMKMEYTISAPKEGTIAHIKVSEGDTVQAEEILVELDA